MHRATSNRRLNSSAVEYSPFDFRTTRSCFITRVSGWKRRTASVIDAANSFESRRVDKSGGGGEILFRTSIFRVSKKKPPFSNVSNVGLNIVGHCRRDNWIDISFSLASV